MRSASSTPFEPFQRDVPIPPVATAGRATKKLEQYVITMKPGTADILPGLQTPILGYNGLLPGADDQGPARARGPDPPAQPERPRRSTCTCTAASPQPQFDGHPHDAIPPARERLYKYPNVAHSATLWYHDHAHGETAPDAVRRARRRSTCSTTRTTSTLDLPQGDYDVPLMIQDRSFNKDGSFRYRFDLDRGFRGDTILVNGAVAPRMKVERRLYRLRFLNASNARAYRSSSATGAR